MGLNSNRFVRTKLCRWLLYQFIRLYCATFRLRIINEDQWVNHVESGGHVLICTWHQQFFSAIRHFKTYERFNPSIMISQSQDGDIIADVAARSGWAPVRGSSSRGGRAALKNVTSNLTRTRLAAHIVDGPRGPAGRVKSGAVRLAHTTGALVVPFSISAENAWYFRSWDKFMLPKPLSIVTLRFGKMIRLEALRTETDVEEQRSQLEEIMRPSLVA
jgi:lysophospholipid acyltransferase (LPLAT)-like uncharacterized protein